MAAAAAKEEFAEAEHEVAAILCGLKPTLLARQRRFRRMMKRLHAPPEMPSWGRRRPRSVPPEEKAAAAAPAPSPAPSEAAERDGAASPDTPLAYPESGGDDAPAQEEEDAKKPTSHSHEQWVQEQHGVVASLSQENAHLLQQIEEYRARLQGSRSTNESLKQLHKVKREREEEEEEQARKKPWVAAQAPGAADPRVAAQAPGAAEPRAAAALGLDLNEPARFSDEEQQVRAQQAEAAAAAAAAAAEWYRQAQVRAAVQKAATAGARRRRLEILRAKVACPLVSSRPRRAG